VAKEEAGNCNRVSDSDTGNADAANHLCIVHVLQVHCDGFQESVLQTFDKI